MRQIFHHYRQISIINPKNSTQPQISGREEIWCNGQRQVYYWNDPDLLMRSPMEDGYLSNILDNPWTGFDHVFSDEPLDEIKTYRNQRSPRYINPDDVIIEPHHKPNNQFPGYQPIAKLGTAISRGVKKIKNMAQKLPSALKIAWHELNRSD